MMDAATTRRVGPPAKRPAGPPAATGRLLAHHFLGDVLAAPEFLIGRLLEDGDGADLAWLFAEHGTEKVRRWFASRGGRQLSSRSRAFWALVLATEPGPVAERGEALWPL